MRDDLAFCLDQCQRSSAYGACEAQAVGVHAHKLTLGEDVMPINIVRSLPFAASMHL